MDADELRALLNLKPKAISSTPQPPENTPQHEKKGQPSPWTLQLDAYDQAQGSKLLRHNKEIRQLELDQTEVADFYCLHYRTAPELVEHCQDARRLEFVKEVLESPDHLALHKRTELNPIASELATEELGKAYAKLKEEDKKRAAEFQQSPNPKKEQIEKDLAMVNAVASALSKSEEKVEAFEDSMTALGCGPGEQSSGRVDTNKLSRLFSKLKDDEKLRKIFAKAGKARRFSQAQKRQKVLHGYDDMVGVTLSGNIGRLLPQELLQLIDVDFGLDATRRLLENQSLSKDYHGIKKVGKGPIVMCVDESGSMSGEPEEWAKAIALTLAWNAKAENRFCVLIGYSGGTEGTKLVLPPKSKGKWDENALLEWLTHFFGAGTDMDVPLEQLPNQWWNEFVKQGMSRGKTDLILVTDAICHVPSKMEQDFLAWKAREQVHCTSIIINQNGGELANISDELHTVPTLDLRQDIVQKILSI